MLAYACVYSFYNQDTEPLDVLEQQTESLELHTNALQILLGEARSRPLGPLACLPVPSEHPIPRNGAPPGPQPPAFTRTSSSF